MTPAELEALALLEKAATKGEWEHGPIFGSDGQAWVWQKTGHVPGDPEAADTRLGQCGEADAAFIAAARNAMPELLAIAMGTPCTTCGARHCSACDTPLRPGRFIHVFDGEDVCDVCNGSASQQLIAERDALRAERDRLRGALERIGAMDACDLNGSELPELLDEVLKA